MSRRIKTAEERFWPKVKKDPNHPKGCWEWTGAITKHRGHHVGYGGFWTGKRNAKGNAISKGAHRWSYEQIHGPVPGDVLVLHHCDNGICVNPDHMFTGDHLTNSRDKSEKGRGHHNGWKKRAAGANPRMIFHPRIPYFRRLRVVYLFAREGLPQYKIATRLGINQSTVSYILREFKVVVPVMWKMTPEQRAQKIAEVNGGEG